MAGERFRVKVDSDVELTIDCSGNLGGSWAATSDYVPAHAWRTDGWHLLSVVDGPLAGQQAEATIAIKGGRAHLSGVSSFRW